MAGPRDRLAQWRRAGRLAGAAGRRRHRGRLPGTRARGRARRDAGGPGRIGGPQVRLRRARDRGRRARQRARRLRPGGGLGHRAGPHRWPRGLRRGHRPGGRAPGHARGARLAALAGGRGVGRLEGAPRSGRGGRAATRGPPAGDEPPRRSARWVPARASSIGTCIECARRARRRTGCPGGPGWRRSARTDAPEGALSPGRVPASGRCGRARPSGCRSRAWSRRSCPCGPSSSPTNRRRTPPSPSRSRCSGRA